jgi:PEP-CTERM motif-containing protein
MDDVDGLTVNPVAVSVEGMGVVSAGTFFGVDSGRLYIVDPATFAATLIGTGKALETITFADDGTLYSHDAQTSLYTTSLDPLGDAFFTNTSEDIWGMAFIAGTAAIPPSGPIPEPTSLALVALGLVGLAWRLRRRGA